MKTIFVEAGEYVDKATYVNLKREFEEYRDDAKEHYGPYGPVCMNIGKFDAGECWLCYMKRKKKGIEEVREMIKRESALSHDHEPTASDLWDVLRRIEVALK